MSSWRDSISDEKLEESFQRAMLAVKATAPATALEYSPLGKFHDFAFMGDALAAAKEWKKAIEEGIGRKLRFKTSKYFDTNGFHVHTFDLPAHGYVLIIREHTYGAKARTNTREYVISLASHESSQKY
jgi:hypothetical protein